MAKRFRMNILIRNATILPMNATGGQPLHYEGDVGIEGERIAFAGADGRQAEEFLARHAGDCRVVEAEGKVVLPGFVNAHTHVAMSLLRGVSDDVPLAEWLEQHIWPIEGRMGRREVFDGARLGILEMLLGGTTTFVDMYPHEDAVAEAAEGAGMRAVVCPCAMDFRMAHFEEDWRRTRERVAGSRLVGTMVGPHAIYTLSEGNLRRAMELADEAGAGIHLHLSETEKEDADARAQHGVSPTAWFDAAGLFGRPTIAAHCVTVSEEDIRVLAERGVSVAHNPQSNMKLGSGIAPVQRMLEAGVNVAIGTDGAASNNDLDMWEEMRTASLLQKAVLRDPCAVPAYTALRMATVNGAKAIGREGELGVVAAGALADLQIVDMGRPHLKPRTDLVSELVYSAHAADVDTVIVNGRIVVERRECLTLDAEEVCRTAQRHLDALMAGV